MARRDRQEEQEEERVAIPIDPQEALQGLLKVDPVEGLDADSPPGALST